MENDILIEAEGIRNQFGKNKIHDGLNFTLRRGEIVGIVGGSGTGKSVLLRTLVGLRAPNAGRIKIAGKPIKRLKPVEKARLMGVLFQHGALFSSMTVLQNVMAPMEEHFSFSKETMDSLARLKIALANLPPGAADKYPSELSGGMVKRAALARALALDPSIVFLDEPTSGLDPISAGAFDELVKNLNKDLGISFVLVTHDLDTLSSICDRVAVLVDKKIITDKLDAILKIDNPWIQSTFHSARAHAAFARETKD